VLPPSNVTYVRNVGADPRLSPSSGFPALISVDSATDPRLCIDVLHIMCILLCVMTMKNYHRTLFEAKQDLARHLVKRQSLDQKIARLQAVVSDLQNLCAERDQSNLEKRIDRVIKADLTVGITESARVILKENFFPMTASEVKEKIEARKLNLARYSNPLAVIHTILKRLVQSGEVRVVPQAKNKNAYQWISTADKLLSELQQSQPAVQRLGSLKESK